MEVLVVRKLVTGMRAEGWPQWPAPVWLGKGKGRDGKGGGGAIVGNESKNFASWRVAVEESRIRNNRSCKMK